MRFKRKIREALCRRAYGRARGAFERSVGSPFHLSSNTLESLVRKYEQIEAKPFQDYSVEAMQAQAVQRVDDLSNRFGGQPAQVLEIGPGSGFVLKEFKRRGSRVAKAIDIVDKLYDEVKDAGVDITLVQDERLPPPPSPGFDVVFSYGTLEHIPDPNRSFQECLKQVAPGGILFFEFGPLYHSPWGYHHQSILRCPYLHLLAPEAWIHKMARIKRGDCYQGFLPWVNKHPLSNYRFLQTPLPPGWIVEEQFFGCDWYSMNIIRQFPRPFKAKGVDFDEFIVDSVRVVARYLPE